MFVGPRERLVDYIRQQLIGPLQVSEDTLAGVLPTERFPCGALYPTSSWGEGIDPSSDSSGEMPDAAITSEDSGAEPAIVRRYVPPSSAGFSFFVTGDEIRLQVICTACRYDRTERDEEGQFIQAKWTRMPLADVDGHVHEIEGPSSSLHERTEVLHQRAVIDSRWGDTKMDG